MADPKSNFTFLVYTEQDASSIFDIGMVYLK